MRKKKIIITIAAIVALLLICVLTNRGCEGEAVSDGSVSIPSAYRFGDVNNVQLAAAQQLGITPMETRSELDSRKGVLRKISTCGHYMLDNLTHSVPYLTPGAAELVDAIGSRFQDKLKANGFREHRIIVTSVLRSAEDVRNLMKGNQNAVKQSAHQYGTTFDIAYTRFNRTLMSGEPVSDQKMAELLGETLKELRDQDRCYVKFERQQHCYHITSRK